MISRKLAPNEEYKLSLCSSVSFGWGMDYIKEKEEAEAMTAESVAEAMKADEVCIPENGIDVGPLPSDGKRNESWATLTDDGATVMGGMEVIPYSVRFDGHTVLMSGIGGVASLPEFRRGGVIRECFRAAFKGMRENGVIFSSLYPFSTAFYRRFGYEIGGDYIVWKPRMSTLKKLPYKGSVTQLIIGSDFSPVTEIYNKMYKDVNLSTVKRLYSDKIFKRDILERRLHTFLYRDEKGVPTGFFTYKRGEETLDASQDFGKDGGFAFLNREAMAAMLSFIKTAFISNYEEIVFGLPADIKLDALFDEGNDVGMHIDYNGMIRVVDVVPALELCKAKGRGEIKIAVRDEMCPWNDGTWRLTYGDGNRVEMTTDTPDISMSIQAFSQLLLGTRDYTDIPMLPDVAVNNPDAPICDVFYKKHCLVTDRF